MAATPCSRFDAAEGAALLDIAVLAIEDRLAGLGTSQPPDLADLPAGLARPGSSFVSLHTAAGLRGCCGTIEPSRALALDVWRNARASAFGDPRFEPLAAREWSLVTGLEVSVLGDFEALTVGSEAELLRELRPGVDGVVLAWRGRRATFLPKVWEQLADARDFVTHLKEKAGWDAGFWAQDIEVLRYRTESVAIPRPAVRSRGH